MYEINMVEVEIGAKYKLQKSTNHFIAIFTSDVRNDEVEVFYPSGRFVACISHRFDDGSFISKVYRGIKDAQENGVLYSERDLPTDRKFDQDADTQYVVNIVIDAYRSTFGSKTRCEVIES